jgi:4'-phosphopantetheinyl transferase
MPDLQQEIARNEVHIWSIQLDRDEGEVNRYNKTLTPEEHKRAARFYFERHCRRHIISHGAMRLILGEYLGANPRDIQFDQTAHGKPNLTSPLKESNLFFNLSHSHELALLAVVLGCEIGVDVEYVKKIGDFNGIAGRFFSASEQAVYFELAEDQRPQAFFNCWTRKEAFIKAIGEGLSYPLHQFDVNLAPGEPPQLLRVEADLEEASCWTLDAFNPTPEYTAAVALRALGVQIRHFKFL